MKSKLFYIFLTLLIFLPQLLSNTFAQDYTQLNLPEGARARLGKGTIINMQLSPDDAHLAIVSSIGVWLYDINTGAETVLLTKMTELVGLLAFSPDGTTLAHTDGDNTCRIWHVENGKLLLTFNTFGGPFRSLKFLADAKTLVCCDWKNIFSFWDITTGKQLNTFSPKASEVRIEGSIWERVLEAFVDHTGNVTFAIGNHDGTISIQDGRTHQLIRTLVARTNDAAFFELREDSREKPIIVRIPAEPEEENDEKPFFTNYREDGTPFPIQYQFQEYSPAQFAKQPMKWIKELKFSQDGKMLVSKSRYWIPKLGGGSEGASGPTEIWNLDTGEQLAALPWYVDAQFSSDSKTLVLISRNAFTRGGCTIWNIVEKRQIAELSGVAEVKFSDNGKTLAIIKSGSYDSEGGVIERGGYTLWDITTHREIVSRSKDEKKLAFLPENVILSQDGALLIKTDQSGTVDVWETKMDKLRPSLIKGYTKAFKSLTFSNDGKILASGDNTGYIHFWNTDDGSKLNMIGRSNVDGLFFDKDDKTLKAVGFGTTVQWDVTSGEQVVVNTRRINLNGPIGPVVGFDDGTTLTFDIHVYSPNFRTLATKNAKDNRIEVWNVITREHLCSLTQEAYKSFWGASALTPDGNILATNNKMKTTNMLLWDTHTDKRIATFNMSKNLVDKALGRFKDRSIYSLMFSHDGKTLAVGIEDKEIQLWDVTDRERVNILKVPHKHAICKLAFSSDGTFLASGDTGGKIHLWEFDTGDHLASYEGHKGNISALVFSQDKKLLASISKHDGTIFLWTVPSK